VKSYLYSWNPTKWQWQDLTIAIHDLINKKPYEIDWSCGNTKRIQINDSFFMMRLGLAPKGIIGCGRITSHPNTDRHWNTQEMAQGKKYLRTKLSFFTLSEDPMVSINELQIRYPNVNWTPQACGIAIPQGVAQALWSDIEKNSQYCFTQPSQPVNGFIEGRPQKITINTYDRSSAARQACIIEHGYTCAVCCFNFEEKYGTLGKHYIEVHHLRPLSEVGQEYEIDPRADLRPVCANCHRILHKYKPPLSIKELKSRIQAVSQSDNNSIKR
jgi:5-methylcytosine-specific restriction protein A